MRQLFTVALLLLLSACSSQVYIADRQYPSSSSMIKVFEKPMYLRGDFTLWDAEPHYRLKVLSTGLYSVKVKFMTPGKVYEFKLADEAWSEGYNCGYKVQGRLQLGQPELVDCSTVYNYFSFMPKQKGWYRITLDYSNSQSPKVIIIKE